MAGPSVTSAWLHEPSVRDRFDGDRLLDEPEGQFAAVSGRSTVEAKGELVMAKNVLDGSSPETSHDR